MPRKAKAAETPPEDAFNGADPAKFDHDGDGQPGGSKKRTLIAHELTGLYAEAYEAYDYMGERIRFDSLGRKWSFWPDKVGQGLSVLRLRIERLDEAHEDTISTALLASDLGKPMVEDVVNKLDAAL